MLALQRVRVAVAVAAGKIRMRLAAGLRNSLVRFACRRGLGRPAAENARVNSAGAANLATSTVDVAPLWRRQRAEDQLTPLLVRLLRDLELGERIEGCPPILAFVIELGDPGLLFGKLGFTEG